MNETCRTHYIVLRRMLNNRLLVEWKEFPLQARPACTDYSHGGGRRSKSGYLQGIEDFSPDRSALASEILVSSSVRARKRCSTSWPQAAYSTTKDQCYYRGYPSNYTAKCDALEHAKHGQGSQGQQGDGVPYMATVQSQTTSGRNIQAQSRQTIRRETARCCWSLSQPAGQSTGLMCRREESDPGPRPNTTLVAITSRYSCTSNTRLYATRNNNVICGPQHAGRQNHRRLYASTSTSGIHPVFAAHQRQNSAGSGFAPYRRQLRHSQTSARSGLAQAASPVPFSLHTDIQFVAQYGRTLVPGNYRQTYPSWFVQKRSGPNQRHYAVLGKPQSEPARFHLERIG